MEFLQNRSEQLADYLRKGIQTGELINPLPPSRAWCEKLGVGRPNLLRALQILESEGLLKISAKGVVLVPVKKKKKDLHSSKTVRWLYPTGNTVDFATHFSALFEQLQLHDIRLSMECCTQERLKSIGEKKNLSHEFFILTRMPLVFQKLFEKFKKPCIVLGLTKPEVSLPYLSPDLAGSTRHATLSLLRRGVKRLVLLNIRTKAEGPARVEEVFRKTCKEWPHQPVQDEVILAWNDYNYMRSAIKRLVNTIREPCGFLVCAPVPVSLLVSHLLQKGIPIPQQAEIIAIEHQPEAVQFSVPVTLYSISRQNYVRPLVRAALHYFETGLVIKEQKLLPMNMTVEG